MPEASILYDLFERKIVERPVLFKPFQEDSFRMKDGWRKKVVQSLPLMAGKGLNHQLYKIGILLEYLLVQ